MVELLKGRIAAFLSQSKVVVTIGLEDGVKKGMKFIIYEEGDLITDPRTGDSLEKLELIKGRIEITSVQEKISIGESFKIVAGSFLDSYIETLSTFSAFGAISKKVKIKLTDNDISESPQLGPVVVGDLVKQVRQVISNSKNSAQR